MKNAVFLQSTAFEFSDVLNSEAPELIVWLPGLSFADIVAKEHLVPFPCDDVHLQTTRVYSASTVAYKDNTSPGQFCDDVSEKCKLERYF